MKQCDSCQTPIGFDDGPEDGWQLENGQTVCHKCCIEDTKRLIKYVIWLARKE